MTPLRVGVDGFNLAMPRGTGVATYARVLTHALAGLGYGVDVLYGATVAAKTPALLREVQFFDALDREQGRRGPAFGSVRWFDEHLLRARPAVATEIPVTGLVDARAMTGRMPRFERVLNAPDLFDVAARHFRRTGRFLRVRVPAPVPDVMHWTYPLPIVLEGARNIYTLHDLVPLRLPFATQDHKRGYLRLLRGCLRLGDHICTVSEFSRTDIVDWLGADPARVTNTYQSALDEQPPDAAHLDDWLRHVFGLERGAYFLFFGAIEPKKNVSRLIEAYLSSGVAAPLVLTGGRSWRAEEELRLLAAGGARIRKLDHVPRAWLAGLVQGARAAVFPSLFEGFGLPVLEAMRVGTPVLTSTESSLPEVAGQAAVLVDPYDVGAIAQSLRQLDADASLRERMASAGHVQAAKFSMSAYQTRLAAMYEAVLARPARDHVARVRVGGSTAIAKAGAS